MNRSKRMLLVVAMVSSFKVNALKGKATTSKSRDVINPFPKRSDNDSMRGKAGKSTQSSYAGKCATSTGFVTSRARELGPFKGSVPVSGLQHTKKSETKNQIKPK